MLGALTRDAFLLVLEQLDAVDLSHAAAVSTAWRDYSREIVRVVLCGWFIVDESDPLDDSGFLVFDYQALGSIEAAAISVQRWLRFKRRHGEVARQFGKLRSMTSFIFEEPVPVCTAVLCDHGLLVLGPGGSVLQGWKPINAGWLRRVRTTEGYLLVRQSFIYDGEWCTNAIAWYII